VDTFPEQTEHFVVLVFAIKILEKFTSLNTLFAAGKALQSVVVDRLSQGFVPGLL
jgi:hypothetical protein